MKALKPKKPSLIEFTRKYSNDEEACYDFFWNARHPDGFVCEKCGCTHYRKITRHRVAECKECGHQEYLFAGTIFQDNKLPLYKLLLGLFLFFTANKGISAVEMRSHLNVNYKTASLLCRKCRILMADDNASNILDSMFYESDVIYIGAKSKEPGHRGMGTTKQPFLTLLSTGEENKYPLKIRLVPVSVDTGENIDRYVSSFARLSKDRLLNTDGKTTYNILKDRITVNNSKIDYSEDDHRLFWLNTIIGNIQNQITGIYHGVSRRELPLFLAEQEFRFNNRNDGKGLIDKMRICLTESFPCPRRLIKSVLNKALPQFASACV